MTRNNMTPGLLSWLTDIMRARYGHHFVVQKDENSISLHVPGASGRIVIEQFNPGFFRTSSDIPFTKWHAEDEGWRSVLGSPLPAPGASLMAAPLIELREGNHVIHYDILGLAYWMLARLEEVDAPAEVLDDHERFPATASHAFKCGYLDRPLVDEWLHILGQVIQRQWPGLTIEAREPRTLVTCDVDSPFGYETTLSAIGRRLAGDILKRRSARLAQHNFTAATRLRREDYSMDTHRTTIDWIMETNERAGRSVAFFFIPNITDPVRDTGVSLDQPLMRGLLRDIHARGHEIGIHPGYNTYRDADGFRRSVDTLSRVLEEEGIEQPIIGGRQHFLRWRTPITARLYESNRLDYDTTLSYADSPGFRCGTCHEYAMFDSVAQEPLRLRQRPLILMECSVIAERYLGLGYSDEALAKMTRYRDTCHRVGGDFTLLWHNSHFGHPKDREFYQKLVG